MEDDFQNSILSQFPHIPAQELSDVVKHTMRKFSKRVGRTGKLDIAEKAQLAVRAHIRHCHTNYDKILQGGTTKHLARGQILDKIDDMARKWGWSPNSSISSKKNTAGTRNTGNHARRDTNSDHRRGKRSRGNNTLKEKKQRKRRASAAASAASSNRALAMNAVSVPQSRPAAPTPPPNDTDGDDSDLLSPYEDSGDDEDWVLD
ncbi:hypothetical protein F4819DRAFT_475171 [Hypoxylon fuscum]|nr:hypothetical protein F4819DRAFT_475171 [Hypoxylon fuscum]